jgi:hypothetical protein
VTGSYDWRTLGVHTAQAGPSNKAPDLNTESALFEFRVVHLLFWGLFPFPSVRPGKCRGSTVQPRPLPLISSETLVFTVIQSLTQRSFDYWQRSQTINELSFYREYI